MTLVLVLLGLLALGIPLFVALGIAALVSFGAYVEGYAFDWSLDLVARKMAELTAQNVFLAVPFFVLSGSIMSAGGISKRLVALAEALVGWMRGGLAIASVGACVIFAAISGSSPVTLIAIGGLMYPAMVKAGYREDFALGLVTSSGSLGMLIPPSVPMLIYAISVSGIASVNVSELFLAGVLPGLFIALLLSIYSFLRSGKAESGRKFSASEALAAAKDGFWALMLPVLILGGIYGGIFTPTEAAAVSVPYALFVEFVIHRELDPKALPGIVLESVRAMGTLVVIIMLSLSLNAFMVEKELGQLMLAKLQAMGLGAVGFMLAMNVFLLFIGMLMDSISAIVLFTPLLVPAAVGLGLDPLHVGIVFIINMEIGYMTPPIGTNLFVASGLFKKPFGDVIQAVLPTVAILMLGLGLVSYIPTLATGPVYALRGEGFVRPFAIVAEPTPAAPAPGDPGKVLSLEEMMKKAAQPAPEPEAAAPKVMTLEEMMKAAAAKNAEEATPPEPAVAAPPRVMTMEEMMKAAAEKAAREQAAPSPEAEAKTTP